MNHSMYSGLAMQPMNSYAPIDYDRPPFSSNYSLGGGGGLLGGDSYGDIEPKYQFTS